MSDIDKVNEMIQDARRALDQMPRAHHDRAACLEELGVALGDRFSITRDADDLEEAIQVSREAVNMTPVDSPDRAGRLSNYGIRLAEKHSMTEEFGDIQDAIRIMRQALDVTPDDDPDLAMYLNNLGTALADQYAQTSSMADLEESIEITQQAITAAVEDHSDLPTYLNSLALRLGDRYARTGEVPDLDAALSAIRDAIDLTPGDSSDRDLFLNTLVIQLGRQYSRTGEIDYLHESIRVAQDIVDTTPFNDSDRPMYLNTLGLSLGELYSVTYESLRRDSLHCETSWTLQSDEDGGFDQQAPASRRYDAGNKFDELIAEIKRQPGFEDFLAAPSEIELMAAAKYGPIVVINTSEYRCDAILVEQHQIRCVPLPDNMEQEARNRDPKKIATLEWLWDTIACPVLNALGFTHRHDPLLEKWPRIWWIATGIMTKFPLHAAGRHDEASASVLDRAMSSYSSSIKTIIQSRRRGLGDGTSVPDQALLVAMRHTPEQASLPFAAREIKTIRDLVKTMHLEPIEPGQHKHDIRTHLPQCKVFHFAGHGHTDGHDPMRSHLLPKDGKKNPLTVADLLEINLRRHLPFLAYLSACGTGRIRDKRFVDESIHLISACQLAGFRHSLVLCGRLMMSCV